MEKERRKNKRVSTRLWVEESGEGYVCFHMVSNLSRGGYFIEKKIPFQVGSEINVAFALPDGGERLRIKGVVVNNYRDADGSYRGAGVRFLGLSGTDEKRIAAFLANAENLNDETGE